MNKEQVLALAKQFAKQANIADGEWSQEAHCAFLVQRMDAIQPLSAAKKLELFALLSLAGLGGNASQFRQAMWPKGKAEGSKGDTGAASIMARYGIALEAPKAPEAPEAPKT